MYRFISGETHRSGREETRGRKKALSKEDDRLLERTHMKLIRIAKGEKRVTHAQMYEAAGLQNKACQRVAEECLRESRTKRHARILDLASRHPYCGTYRRDFLQRTLSVTGFAYLIV